MITFNQFMLTAINSAESVMTNKDVEVVVHISTPITTIGYVLRTKELLLVHETRVVDLTKLYLLYEEIPLSILMKTFDGCFKDTLYKEMENRINGI